MAKFIQSIICLFILTILLLTVSGIVSAEKQYFYVFDTGGPYKVETGAVFNLNLTIDNKGLKAPKNVTIRVPECPSEWTCESKTVSFNKSGRFPVPLKITVPKTAHLTKYSLVVTLYSYWRTERGDDLSLIWVSDEPPYPKSTYVFFPAGDNTLEKNKTIESKTVSYTYPSDEVRYVPSSPEASTKEASTQKETEQQVALSNNTVPVSTEPDIDVISSTDLDDTENQLLESELDKLESELDNTSDSVAKITGMAVSTAQADIDSEVHFWKYATIALYALLLLTAIGAYNSHRKR